MSRLERLFIFLCAHIITNSLYINICARTCYMLTFLTEQIVRNGCGHRMDVPLSWLIIAICLIGSFFFSASETALSCCNRFKIQIKADNGSKIAKLLLKVCDRFDRALTAILIGNNIVAITASVVSATLFVNFILPEATYGLNKDTVSLISSICMTFLFYILGDTLPKTIAKAIPDTVSYIVVIPVYLFMILLYPIAVIFELMTKTIEKIFKVKTDDKFTEEDFENVIEKTTSDGLFEQEQTEIIQSALEFIDTNVREVLTPKKDVFALDINTLTHDKMKEILLNTNYSRIPVYDQQPDNIIGILIVKTYFKEITKNTNVSIRKILSKPYFVPNTIMIDDLFNGFKKNHSHIAIVRDKDHKMVGMVTMEDVLEELVSGIGEPNTPKEKK